MAIERRLEPVDHPRWSSPEKRKNILIGVMKVYGLKAEDVARLTGRGINTVYAWRNPDKIDAPPIPTLRSLLYDLLISE